jgi:hypothetical protein
MTGEKYGWIFEFGLTERCPYKSIENSSSIQLKTQMDDVNKTKYITGFTISIRDSTEDEAEYEVDRQAKVLADIISVKRERYVSYYKLGRSMIRPDKTQRAYKDLVIRYHREPTKTIKLPYQ